jgi:hypothetical protein
MNKLALKNFATSKKIAEFLSISLSKTSFPGHLMCNKAYRKKLCSLT